MIVANLGIDNPAAAVMNVSKQITSAAVPVVKNIATQGVNNLSDQCSSAAAGMDFGLCQVAGGAVNSAITGSGTSVQAGTGKGAAGYTCGTRPACADYYKAAQAWIERNKARIDAVRAKQVAGAVMNDADKQLVTQLSLLQSMMRVSFCPEGSPKLQPCTDREKRRIQVLNAAATKADYCMKVEELRQKIALVKQGIAKKTPGVTQQTLAGLQKNLKLLEPRCKGSGKWWIAAAVATAAGVGGYFLLA